MYNLLSHASTNSKTKKGDLDRHEAAILYLAPATVSGRNVCPSASPGCASACLYSAGRGRFSSVQKARRQRTELFWANRARFIKLLVKDLQRLESRATKRGKKPVVRLNGTSDILWPVVLFKAFPNIQFYDYTKNLATLKRIKALNISNYHLTFSLAEHNLESALAALNLGFNVAAVFRDHIPDMYLNRPVLDGDSHDFRFQDPSRPDGYIIGLKAKGDAKRDQSGFVIDIQTKELNHEDAH